MQSPSDLKELLEGIMKLMQQRFRDTLKSQGHINKGKLRDSIDYVIEVTGDYAVAEMFLEDYGVYVSTGVRAEKVNYPIQVMIDWWQDRGLSEREATSAAYATKAVHKREGIPTRASARFSETGERTGFIERVIEESLDDIGDLVRGNFGASVDIKFAEELRLAGINLKA